MRSPNYVQIQVSFWSKEFPGWEFWRKTWGAPIPLHSFWVFNILVLFTDSYGHWRCLHDMETRYWALWWESTACIPAQKVPVIWSCGVFCAVRLKTFLTKMSRCRWFHTIWRWCDVTNDTWDGWEMVRPLLRYSRLHTQLSQWISRLRCYRLFGIAPSAK